MNIIIAPDSFKGSLTSIEAAEAIAYGFKECFPAAKIVCVPMADGGEGTLDCISRQLACRIYSVEVADPLLDRVSSQWIVLPDGETVVIETAQACGLTLIPITKRNPLLTSSIGVGEQILDALNKGFKKFIVTLGGSATCDGAIGALSALGVKFADAHGKVVPKNGMGLLQAKEIDLSHIDPRISNCHFKIAYDVSNPLVGEQGAVLYAKQKGADISAIERLKIGFERYGDLLNTFSSSNIAQIPGSGAAGGMGAGFAACLNAQLYNGAEMIMEIINFSERLNDADLVVTGEGKIDLQTRYGKVPYAIASLAKKMNIPVIAFAGDVSVQENVWLNDIFQSIHTILKKGVTIEQSKRDAKYLLQSTANEVAKRLKFKQFDSE